MKRRAIRQHQTIYPTSLKVKLDQKAEAGRCSMIFLTAFFGLVVVPSGLCVLGAFRLWGGHKLLRPLYGGGAHVAPRITGAF